MGLRVGARRANVTLKRTFRGIAAAPGSSYRWKILAQHFKMGAATLTWYTGSDSNTTSLELPEGMVEARAYDQSISDWRANAMIVDDATFQELVNAHYQPLYRFAFSLSHSEAQAWDLTQETFRKFATKGHQLSALSKAKTWLFTTLYREFIDGHRRDARLETLDDGEHELESVSPADQADQFDGALARQALLQIDPVFRAPLTLFYLQDLTYREIAEILKLPLGTVMSRISRGRSMLRQLLTEPRHGNRVVPLTPVSEVK